MKVLAIGLVLLLVCYVLGLRRKAQPTHDIPFFNLIQGMTALFGSTLTAIGGFVLVSGMK